MKVILSDKDVSRIEAYSSTDVASISVWENNLKGSFVDINTGSDGNFKVIVCFNQPIENNEKKLIHKVEKGVILNIENKLYIGSTHWKDENVEYLVSNNIVDEISLPAGKYIADICSLLVPNELNNGFYLQIALCLYFENNYPDKSVEIHQLTETLNLGYEQ